MQRPNTNRTKHSTHRQRLHHHARVTAWETASSLLRALQRRHAIRRILARKQSRTRPARLRPQARRSDPANPGAPLDRMIPQRATQEPNSKRSAAASFQTAMPSKHGKSHPYGCNQPPKGIPNATRHHKPRTNVADTHATSAKSPVSAHRGEVPERYPLNRKRSTPASVEHPRI